MKTAINEKQEASKNCEDEAPEGDSDPVHSALCNAGGPSRSTVFLSAVIPSRPLSLLERLVGDVGVIDVVVSVGHFANTSNHETLNYRIRIFANPFTLLLTLSVRIFSSAIVKQVMSHAGRHRIVIVDEFVEIEGDRSRNIVMGGHCKWL
ncbi:hypothetical protein GQ43DRAFT_462484 [Delitschia confertaspora ATCC 74209]|uniref:Uncharacterized protein n=1 Tax=Delitschia confertaspora ATCC 74209 TaxID=1513339 RepID=A0A9P4JQ34_9PLEO|nr:hypothetical protein GQ43DRAFT_462484 [Delitschia confertaspora ATCC 74209]